MSELEILLTKASAGAPGVLTIYLVYWVTKRLADILDRVCDRLDAVAKAVETCPKK